jgi:uncharacterized protein (DUF697 family)
VEDVDIKYLAGNNDLKNRSAPLVSVLDSTRIDYIASNAIRITAPRARKRPYVADPLKVVLTLTNLSGIPYATEAGTGNSETQTLYHADQANFEVRWDQSSAASQAVLLSPHSPQNWSALAASAKATGGFPVVLAPRLLDRNTGIYNNRRWRVSKDKPALVDGQCQCEGYEPMRPNWCYGDDMAFTTLNVDGGVTNNNPFECAHQELCMQEPPQAGGHNPRSPQEADRAVISIAPFLSTSQFDIANLPDSALPSVIGKLVSTLINQSRIQGENILLTASPDIFTRWAISPSIEDTTRKALASAALGAFGGFLAKEFRDHDYQLGRRNCQWFLKQHFRLPLDNVVIKDYALSERARQKFVRTLPDGSSDIGIIPLLSPLDPDTNPIPEVKVKISRERLVPIVDAVADRLKLVSSRLLLGVDSGWLKELGFGAVWLILGGKLKRTLLTKLRTDLARQDLIQGSQEMNMADPNLKKTQYRTAGRREAYVEEITQAESVLKKDYQREQQQAERKRRLEEARKILARRRDQLVSSDPELVASNKEILTHAAYAAAAALATTRLLSPMLSVTSLAGIQLKMLSDIAKVFHIPFSEEIGKAFIGSLTGSLGTTALVTPTVTGVLGFLPIIRGLAGRLSYSVVAFGSTYAVGKVFQAHFASGGNLLNFNPAKARDLYKTKFQQGTHMAPDSLLA